MKQNQNARRNKPGRMNNQNNRNKGGKGGKGHQGGRGQQPTSMNKQVDSHGPAGKQRGTAKQLYEKYKTLSKECYSSDRQLSESLAQYADHYYRIFAEFAAAEAATQLMREKEKARKEQEEAERRANSVPVQDNFAEEKAPEQKKGPSRKNGQSRGADRLEKQAKKPVEPATEKPTEKSAEKANEKPAENAGDDVETSLPAFLENAIPKTPARQEARKGRKASAAKKENLTLDLDLPAGDKAEQNPVAEEKPAPKRRGRPRKKPLQEETAKDL